VLQAHTQDVKRVIWHPELNVLASCSYDNRIKLYKEDGDDDWACFSTLSSHDSTVWSISFEKSGKRLASCGEDKTVKIWQEYSPENQEGDIGNSSKLGMKKDPTWKCICTISGYHSRCVYDVDWNQNNGLLATASGDDSIKIFGEATFVGKADELNMNEPSFELKTQIEDAHTQDVNSVAWNPMIENLLASASDDGIVKLWCLERDSDDNV